MASSLLELIFKTSKQGQGGKAAAQELKEVKATVGDLTSNFLGFNAASLTAAGAIAAVGAFAIDSTKRFMEYGEQIRGLTALTGTGAEETSRMMQAFDDMGISAEKFGTAIEQSAKKGFVFTLENVKALADEYNALETQEEKNALLNDKLGRSGTQLAKAFREGGAAIEEYYNAVSDGQALTEAEIENADKLRRNLDALGDTIDSVALTVGGTFAEGINTLIDRSELYKQVAEETGLQIQYMGKDAAEAAVHNWELSKSQEWVAENSREAKEMLGGYGYTAAGLDEQLDPAIAAQDELNQLMQSYTDKMLFKIAAENLDADAQAALAESMGLVEGKTRYAVVKTQEFTQLLNDKKISVEQYGALVSGLADYLAGIESKTAYIDIITRYSTQGGSGGGGAGGIKPGEINRPVANGTEGWETVPAGYPGDTYMLALSSGERYQVQNDRQRWTGDGEDGGGFHVHFGNVSITNGMTLQQFEGRLEEAYRRARR